ncbi:EAL domain-containing protein [Mycolicibacterium austroafricanum]|uniref:EAL domain-containing protein n=1 Tax=Mycolicibacterium austroafricanum TaxID=39687 RepID=UPI001CA3702D|nr:EAL domain-containing protein [Mycolicibacterium austroafricanum]QZT58406.1 EAL domain-containing protein [Mycolicibacterium austroafricanum]
MTNHLDDAATGAGLVPVFQSVVSLPGETVVGYEALARWPALNGMNPAEVFDRAQRIGTLDRLDCECIGAAARGALDGPSTDGMLLLLNCEPATTLADPSCDAALAAAADKFHVVFELTERGLLANPQAMLRKVAALRSHGFAIALDDIGAHRDSLAVLDIVAPDILKLDLAMIQAQADQHQARTIAAVLAHQERTGATILAEGIETDAHLEQALAYGATLGQGYRFGYRGARAAEPARVRLPTSAASPSKPGTRSVFEASTAGIARRVVRKRNLLELSRHLERRTITADSPPIVLTTVQKHDFFQSATSAMYTAIAERSPLVAVFGVDIPEDLGAGIRGVPLDPADPLAREWIIVVIGSDNCVGLIARELPGTDRRFEVVITFDRERVATAARSLLDRVRSA